MTKRADTVDEYIDASPPKVRQKLRVIRKIIKKQAPKALEKISYGIPYYGYHGRLAYFAYTKDHIGLYLMPPVLDKYKNKLGSYKTAKATIQLPLDKEIPVKLVSEMVKYGKELNEGVVN